VLRGPFPAAVQNDLSAISAARLAELRATVFADAQVAYKIRDLIVKPQELSSVDAPVDVFSFVEGAPDVSLLNMGVLLASQRSAAFGSVFNYPRTLLIGPDASFASAQQGTLSAAPIPDDRKFTWANLDHIIWVNNHHESGASGAVEVHVARFNHGQEDTTGIRVDVFSSRFHYGSASPAIGSAPMDQLRSIVASIAVPGASNVVPMTNHMIIEAGSIDTSIKGALAVIERFTRDRVARFDLIDAQLRLADAVESVYRSVLMGYLSFAATDIVQPLSQPPRHAGVVSSLADLAHIHQEFSVSGDGGPVASARAIGSVLPCMEVADLTPTEDFHDLATTPVSPLTSGSTTPE